MKRGIFNSGNLRRTHSVLRGHSLGQILNVLRFEYAAFRGFRKTHLPYSPVWLTLFITSRCNLRCRQCPFRSPGTPRETHLFRDMSMDSFRQILDQFPRAIGVHLTGGEPLLHPELFDLIHLAHERSMKVRIPTNGTLLSRNIDAFLAAPVEMLNVSLYGADAETFTILTGAKAALFDEAVEAVAELAGRRPKGGRPHIIRASFICTKQTMQRAVDFVHLCENLGVDQVILHNLFHFGIPGYDESMCLYEDDPEVRLFFEDLRRQCFNIPVFLPKLYKREYRPPTCTMPYGLLSIDGDGFIGPCCVKGTGRQWSNVFDTKQAWNSPTMIEARRDLLDPTCPLPDICLHCEEMIRDRQCLDTRK